MSYSLELFFSILQWGKKGLLRFVWYLDNLPRYTGRIYPTANQLKLSVFADNWFKLIVKEKKYIFFFLCNSHLTRLLLLFSPLQVMSLCGLDEKDFGFDS